MQSVAVSCPKCGASIEQPRDRNQFYCSYCGSLVQLQGNAVRVEQVVRSAPKEFVCPVDGRHQEQPDFTCPLCHRAVCSNCYGERLLDDQLGRRWLCNDCLQRFRLEQEHRAMVEWQQLERDRQERAQVYDSFFNYLLWCISLVSAGWLACIGFLGGSEYVFFWEHPAFQSHGGWLVAGLLFTSVVTAGIGLPFYLVCRMSRIASDKARFSTPKGKEEIEAAIHHRLLRVADNEGDPKPDDSKDVSSGQSLQRSAKVIQQA